MLKLNCMRSATPSLCWCWLCCGVCHVSICPKYWVSTKLFLTFSPRSWQYLIDEPSGVFVLTAAAQLCNPEMVENESNERPWPEGIREWDCDMKSNQVNKTGIWCWCFIGPFMKKRILGVSLYPGKLTIEMFFLSIVHYFFSSAKYDLNLWWTCQ